MSYLFISIDQSSHPVNNKYFSVQQCLKHFGHIYCKIKYVFNKTAKTEMKKEIRNQMKRTWKEKERERGGEERKTNT